MERELEYVPKDDVDLFTCKLSCTEKDKVIIEGGYAHVLMECWDEACPLEKYQRRKGMPK